MSKARAAAVVGALLVLLATACSGGGGSSGSDEPIRIGISLPLTGEFSEPGKAAKQGYEVWAKHVNASGGVLGRKVELVIRDDASKQNLVVSDYNQLISRERVDLLLGTFSSLLNLPASAVAERNQMVFVEPAGGAPELFERGFKFLFFSQQAVSDRQGDLFVDYILGLPEGERPKTAAYPSVDDPFALPVLDAIRAKLEAAGIQTVYKTTYPLDTTNFDSVANSVKAAEPDLVVNGATFADGVGFVRAMNKVGFDPAYFFQTSAPSFADQYANGVGVENTEGTFFAVSHTPEASTPGNQEFVQTHRDMFGAEPAEDAADAYASAEVLAAAVEAVGSTEDQRKLADWLHENEVETILGPLSWDDLGRPQGEFMIGQWQSGKAEIVFPESAATTDGVVGP